MCVHSWALAFCSRPVWAPELRLRHALGPAAGPHWQVPVGLLAAWGARRVPYPPEGLAARLLPAAAT